MAKTMRTVGLDFFDSAAKRIVATARFSHPPAAVFAALADDPADWGHWFPGFSKTGHYLTPAPHGAGSRREVTVLGQRTIEAVLVSDQPNRWAFAIEQAMMPGVRAIAENYQIEATPDGSELTWTMAIDAPKPVAALIASMGKVAFGKAGKNLERYLGRR